LTFFGLNSEYRQIFRQEVFDLSTNSDGGFSFTEVWEMPIPMRKMFLKKIKEKIDKHNEAIEKQKGHMTMQDMIKKKPIVPDFITPTPVKK